MNDQNNIRSVQNTGGKLKNIFLFIALFLFAGLFVQQAFKIVPVITLRGEYIPKQKPELTSSSWFNRSYQDSLEGYLNENFGFRDLLVRIDHQIKFWFFKKASSMAIRGKDNHFYISDYIDSYNGKDFCGENSINDSIAKLKFLNDTLASMGKTFLVVMAPNKARIYPEFIPDHLKQDPGNNTNYYYYSAGLKKAGINFIDFNSIFLTKKAKTDYLLFSQLGTHWSRLEAVRATDTILGELSYLSKVALPRIKIKGIVEKDSLEYPDYDIADGMNLIWTPPYAKMGYPEIEFITENKVKKRALVISDSYWTDIYFRQIPRTIFSVNEFWYYNKSSWGNLYTGKREVKDRDLKRAILQYDFIILVSSETNYKNLGFGFAGAAASALRRPITPTPNELNEIQKEIKKNAEWVKDIHAKAEKNKISYDSMLVLDAQWYFQHYGPAIRKKSVKDVREDILQNKAWMDQMPAKAKERNISVDSMLNIDALWAYNTLVPAGEKEISTIPSKTEVIKSIKNNPDWMKQIREKAKERNISEDSMINLDAMWYLKELKQ
jgi:hypothetical protein